MHYSEEFIPMSVFEIRNNKGELVYPAKRETEEDLEQILSKEVDDGM